MSAAWHRAIGLLRPVRSGGCQTAGSDRELLARFATAADHPAFAALVDRHGRMVLGVSRQVLGNAADADDAFQAVFLILARKAGRTGWRESAAGWLYETTLRVCHRVRRGNARREALRAALSTTPFTRRTPVPAPDSSTLADDERAVLLDELGKLPTKYRDPLVLCYLRGETCETAARLLGCPVGTVKVRVSRAKERLRESLARRGVVASVAVVGGVLSGVVESARVSASVADAIVQAAVAFATGVAVLSPAARLAQGHLAGSGTAIKVATIVVALGGAIAGVALTGGTAPTAPPATPVASVAPLPTGAVLRLGDTRFRHGDQVRGVAFSADGSRIVSASADHGVVVWDAATCRDLLTMLPEQGRVTALAVLPGDTVVTAGESSPDVRAWDMETGNAKRAYTDAARGYAVVAASADGKVLAAAGTDKVVYVWDVTTGKEQARLKGHGGRSFRSRSVRTAPRWSASATTLSRSGPG